jgi:predicted DNA binding CopG/RHH family protein
MTATIPCKAAPSVTAAELDALAEAGDIVALEQYFDAGAGESPNLTVRRINLDLPEHLIEGLDAVAAYLAIPRQAVIKTMIVQSLKEKTLMM